MGIGTYSGDAGGSSSNAAPTPGEDEPHPAGPLLAPQSGVAFYAHGPRSRKDNGWTVVYCVLMALVFCGGIVMLSQG
jgi:hypothetical protein